jgi:hypothetical protein
MAKGARVRMALVWFRTKASRFTNSLQLERGRWSEMPVVLPCSPAWLARQTAQPQIRSAMPLASLFIAKRTWPSLTLCRFNLREPTFRMTTSLAPLELELHTHIIFFFVGDGSDTDPYTYQELILPNGARVRFDRITAGTNFNNAVYVHVSSGTPFYGARIVYVPNPSSWLLTLRDGSSYVSRFI